MSDMSAWDKVKKFVWGYDDEEDNTVRIGLAQIDPEWAPEEEFDAWEFDLDTDVIQKLVKDNVTRTVVTFLASLDFQLELEDGRLFVIAGTDGSQVFRVPIWKMFRLQDTDFGREEKDDYIKAFTKAVKASKPDWWQEKIGLEAWYNDDPPPKKKVKK